MKILLFHGWQSIPGGVKPTFLKDHGHEVLNPDLPDDDFDAVARIVQARPVKDGARVVRRIKIWPTWAAADILA